MAGTPTVLQDGEIFVLLSGLAVLVLLIIRRSQLARMRFVYAGFVFLVASYCFTVAEDYVFAEALNLAEHIAMMLASLSFVVGFARMSRDESAHEGVQR